MEKMFNYLKGKHGEIQKVLNFDSGTDSRICSNALSVFVTTLFITVLVDPLFFLATRFFWWVTLILLFLYCGPILLELILGTILHILEASIMILFNIILIPVGLIGAYIGFMIVASIATGIFTAVNSLVHSLFVIYNVITVIVLLGSLLVAIVSGLAWGIRVHGDFVTMMIMMKTLICVLAVIVKQTMIALCKMQIAKWKNAIEDVKNRFNQKMQQKSEQVKEKVSRSKE